MSITDELREWAKGSTLSSWTAEHLTAIADRIDAEHEGELLETGNNILRDVRRTWVLLPKDADGVPIHVGDELIDEDDKLQKPAIVKCILYNDEGCVVSDIDPRGCWYDPSLLRHYHAPTVEDVLTEFGIDWEHESDCEDRAALLKEYASKLRLAEGEDA